MGLLPDPAIRCPPCEPHPAECEGEALVLLVGPVEEGPQGLLHPDAGVPLAGRHPWAPCWAPAVAGGGRPCEGPCGAQYTCARGQAAVRGVVGAGVSQKQRARQGGARTLLVAGDPHGALRGECHRDLPFPRCISTSAAASVLPVAGSCGRDGVKQGVRLDAARQPAVAGGGLPTFGAARALGEYGLQEEGVQVPLHLGADLRGRLADLAHPPDIAPFATEEDVPWPGLCVDAGGLGSWA